VKKYTLALDLIDESELINQYEDHHVNSWPEINQSIIDSGIHLMEIYRTGNRLFMIIETDDTFSFEGKRLLDAQKPKVLEWESLMWKFQQPLPWSKEGEKWVLMKKIFELDNSNSEVDNVKNRLEL